MIYTIGVGRACLPAPAPVDGGACFRIGGFWQKNASHRWGTLKWNFAQNASHRCEAFFSHFRLGASPPALATRVFAGRSPVKNLTL